MTACSDDPRLIVDLFAGPGGWDVGARWLGLNPIGIEVDTAACATRRAAGLRTVQADVATLPLGDTADIWGLIASPPCQTFSMAGKGAGRRALDDVLAGVTTVASGGAIPTFDDTRTSLVLEPLRYALLFEPEWIAWEQVPPVLPIWQACATVLRGDGYNVWTGKLSAECYGVPQTRKRAVLIASRTREVGEPPPTHRAYRKGVAQQDGDPSLLPWVSMAEALGWGMVARPFLTVTTDTHVLGSSASRETFRGERDLGRFVDRPRGGEARSIVGFPRRADTPTHVGSDGGEVTIDGVAYRARDLRTDDLPAQTITARARSWKRWSYVNGTQANAAVRDAELPAPTVHFGARGNDVRWASERPATTICGDPRVAAPGHHGPSEQFKDGARVTVEDAAILQSFPPGYPWQGSKTKQYQQVGNAIPPLLAAHVLAEATGVALLTPRDVLPGRLDDYGIGGQARSAGPGARRAPRRLDEPSYTVRANGSGSHPSGVEWVATNPEPAAA